MSVVVCGGGGGGHLVLLLGGKPQRVARSDLHATPNGPLLPMMHVEHWSAHYAVAYATAVFKMKSPTSTSNHVTIACETADDTAM